ncbi:multidrug/biocide efflux PACE transporter [Alcaligenaceae bacterium CGII-47]|nr:multidrug/biocide efflux PACE transporter [Alcaligenaceae bacterium CGII-47]
MNLYERSLAERVLHALLFEVLAIGISAPLAAWITGETVLSMGVLTAIIATMAVLWNMLYNWLFDRLQTRRGFKRTLWVRAIHSAGFEIGLIIMVIPIIAWWLDTTLWHALILDIGLVLFYMPYAFVFNLCYDKIKLYRMMRA